jgi:two-component system sensor histidine kinase UhpB
MANGKILVVEDDPAVADLIARYLKRSGYEVAACVATGEGALVEAARTRPDLALMDIELHGALDGVQTAGQLRARFNVPVVFLTGLADDETLKRSQDAQAFGYLLKPFRQEDLKASIDLALSKHPVESKLRRIEGWFTAAIKSIVDAVITVDEQSRVTFLNPTAEMLTGWKMKETAGRALGEVFQIDQEGEWSAPNHAALRARNGVTVPIEWSEASIRDEQDAVIGRVLIFRDVTERQRAEAQLKESREQLRLLAAHLQNVREEERTRIAREVHDELGQMITGLKMDLSWIEKRLPEIADVAAREPVAAKAKSMSELLDRTVKTVRKIASELRPGVLDDLGLLPAIEWQARDWQARTGIECQVSASLEGVTVSPERSTALFRIFQEVLTNVARHAQATRVRARISADDGWLVMEVQDNGRGITEEDQHRPRSFGVLGMQERAALLGGKCAVTGEPGVGTAVRVRIPLTAEARG